MIELATANARLRIAPELGGAIVDFTLGGRAILRPTPATALADGNVRLAGCYPLVPFSNRIRNARLSFDGREYALARNFGAHPHAIHGVGWQRAWTLAEASDRHARIVLDHAAQGDEARSWPWPFRVAQTFRLTQGAGDEASVRLVVTLTLRNTGDAAFPFGLGWHPFFPKDAETRLRFDAQRVWQNDAEQLPQSLVEIPEAWRFDRARTLDRLALDNVFTGWRGRAAIVQRSTAITAMVDADRACACLVVYAPLDRAFVAVEPVTHETDAFNRAAAGAACTGTRILPPGAAFSCTMRIAVALTA